jgi:hypothetical protein
MDAGRPGNKEVVLDSASERTKLEHELARARDELAVINQKLEEKGDFGLGQGASTVYEWEMNLALRESAEAKIKSIQVALERLDHGDYGKSVVSRLTPIVWKSCHIQHSASNARRPIVERLILKRGSLTVREPLLVCYLGSQVETFRP